MKVQICQLYLKNIFIKKLGTCGYHGYRLKMADIEIL